jgi:hypothetical protein
MLFTKNEKQFCFSLLKRSIARNTVFLLVSRYPIIIQSKWEKTAREKHVKRTF